MAAAAGPDPVTPPPEPGSPKPAGLTLRRLRLTGFKSFVDPADLVIEAGLTGVVGPNGCGKSNLLEALRWTMGENSARSMRGAGMDDVIFAGTATRPQRDFAEVAILAQDTAGDEIEVVRRIERGAGSAYRINGRDVRAKDVGLLFADAATSAHSPALVSQNRIGAIIAARPGERRAMLEDAAGIAGLHVRRRDAEQRLRATEANLQRLGEVIAEQDGRAAALKRQARQAERYRDVTDRIRIVEERMIFARWRDAAAAADAAKADAADADAQVGDRNAAHAKSIKAQAIAARTLADARAAAQTARDRLAEASHRRERIVADTDATDRRLHDLSATLSRLAEDRLREGTLASDAAGAIARLTREAQALDLAVAATTERLPILDAELAILDRRARDAEVAHAQALAEQASERAEARVAAAARDAAAARLARVLRDEARLLAERRGLADPTGLAVARDEARLRRGDALATADSARLAIGSADADERAAIDARGHAQALRAAANAELATIDAEIAALTRALRRGGDARLVDMLRVEPGFEAALAAALGDDLESGLDPAEDRHWAGAEPQFGDPPPPPGTTRLSTQVQAPAALARRLTQILVAETDPGMMLAPGQRLVTLEGAVRRWDGFVTRAGAAAATAERLARTNRLRILHERRPDLAGAVDHAAAMLSTADAAISAARAAVATARRALDSAEAAAREAGRSEDRATAAIERAEAQATDLDRRLAELAIDLADARSEADRSAAALHALPDGRETGVRVAALASAAEDGRRQVAVARTVRTAAEAALVRDRERGVAATTEAENWQARAGDAARRIAEIDQRIEATQTDHAGLSARPAVLAADLAALDDALASLSTATAAAVDAETRADRMLREIESAAATIAEALSAARELRAGAVARVESHELRRIEMGRLSGERFECPPPLLPGRAGFAAQDVDSPAAESATHEKLLAERDRIGPVNLVAERELAELEAGRDTNARDRAELEEAVHRLRGSIGTLNHEGRQRLMTAFAAVDGHFRRLFATLFNGGQAHLELVDSDDPLEAGLEILAQPPGKKLQSLTLLSGGEQALTAVALIFALFLTNPAPICVLDEVDAPLDDANIERFCDLLDTMTRATDTRYLIVTHNAATMSRMHRLFGVTMVERGVSRLVSVDLTAATDMVALP